MSINVTVIGSINRDDSISVAQLPGAGETVTASASTTTLGGKGANQAIAAARAGAAVRMVGAIGVDGDQLIDALTADGINVGAVARTAGPSGHAVVLVDASAENSIVVVPGANERLTSTMVVPIVQALTKDDVVVLQHEIPVAVSRAAVAAARRAGASVIWNAAPAPASAADLLRGIDLLIVNEHELTRVAALLGVAACGTIESTLRAVSGELGCDVVATLGADGAATLVEDRFLQEPSRRVDAVDTTAAGDTFVGYLAAATGRSFAERLRLALDAAALTVTRAGASGSIPTIAEVTANDRGAPAERTHP